MRSAHPLALLLLLPSIAPAAEVTDLPPRYRGDVHVGYDGWFEQVGLEEDGGTYGIRNTLRNDLTLRAEGAVFEGLALTLGFPITAGQRIWYPAGEDGVPAAREMLYEPVTGQGSFRNGQPLDNAPDIASSGLQGVWIGLAAAPFREDYAKGLPVTTRFDFAVRTPSPAQTLYGANRGAAPGGVGIRLSGAFSMQRGVANPYMKVDYVGELPAEVEVTNLDGTSGGTVRVQEASRVSIVGGAELVASYNAETQTRIAFDLWVGMAYNSYADRASGFWLPSVLPLSQGVPVTQSEYLTWKGGLALDVHITRFVGFRLGAEGQYFLPHRVEHLYPARTDPQSFAIGWTAALVGRIRLKGDRL